MSALQLDDERRSKYVALLRERFPDAGEVETERNAAPYPFCLSCGTRHRQGFHWSG